MRKNNIKEKGQIVYLVAIGIVLMFGFLGLAVDGGRLYSENRQAQHAADNAALTGALFIGQNYELLEDQQQNGDPYACGGGVYCISNETSRIAMENAGFTISDLLIDYDVTAQPSPYSGIKYVDIVVELEVEIIPYFAQVFTDQTLKTKVNATARVYPKQNFAFGYSMLATEKSVCHAIIITGSIDITLNSGGLHSNSTGCEDSIDIKGGAQTTVTLKGPFTGSSPFKPTGKPNIDSSYPYTVIDPFEIDDPPIPECETPDILFYEDPDTGFATFNPGNHTTKFFETPGTVVFNPGIYCISGDLSFEGGTFIGEGVLFYMKDGDFRITGNPELHFSAPTGNTTDVGGINIFDGLLLYMNPEEEGEVVFVGNAFSTLTGTVYNVGPGGFPKCKLTGTSVSGTETITLGLQLICSTIKAAGNTTLNLVFDDEDLYAPPAELSLLH